MSPIATCGGPQESHYVPLGEESVSVGLKLAVDGAKRAAGNDEAICNVPDAAPVWEIQGRLSLSAFRQQSSQGRVENNLDSHSAILSNPSA